jgi:hypothetical protein
MLIGPAGNLFTIMNPKPGLNREPSVPQVEHATLNNIHRVDNMGFPKRQYSMDFPLMTIADYNVLNALKLGAYGPGPFVYIDPVVTNLLPPNAATATAQTHGLDGGWNTNVGTLVAAANTTALLGWSPTWVVPTSTGIGNADLNIGSSITDFIPVQVSTQYTFQIRTWSTGAATFAPKAEVEWYDALGVAIGSPVQGSAQVLSGTPVQCSVTATSPSNAAYVQVTLTNSAATVAQVTVFCDQLMLATASGVGTWAADLGQPRVAIMDLKPGVQRLLDPWVGTRQDISMVLQEVGG